MGNLTSISKQNISNHPTLPILMQFPHDDFTIRDIGSRRMLRLFSIGLFQLWTIHIAEIHHILSALMVDCQTISLVDRNDPCDELCSSHYRTWQSNHHAQKEAQDLHDFPCYPSRIVSTIFSRFDALMTRGPRTVWVPLTTLLRGA